MYLSIKQKGRQFKIQQKILIKIEHLYTTNIVYITHNLYSLVSF